MIGCGGVGDAAIAGAALVGAKRIIAVDTDNKKLEWAREFGATHTINAKELDVRWRPSRISPTATAPTS